jgi:hypothetical protein
MPSPDKEDSTRIHVDIRNSHAIDDDEEASTGAFLRLFILSVAAAVVSVTVFAIAVLYPPYDTSVAAEFAVTHHVTSTIG